MDRLAPTTLGRLVKLLGRLGSDHDGEIAVAGRMANALVRQHGLTWADIIAPPLAPLDWRAKCRRCVDRADCLNAWERQFIGSLLSWRGPLTERQLAKLDAIYASLP
jgi:hypothetical protein